MKIGAVQADEAILGRCRERAVGGPVEAEDAVAEIGIVMPVAGAERRIPDADAAIGTGETGGEAVPSLENSSSLITEGTGPRRLTSLPLAVSKR